MKTSTSLISFLVLVHLFIIDGIFLMLATTPSMDYLILLAYNTIWLFIAFRIWNFRYQEIYQSRESNENNESTESNESSKSKGL